MRRAGAAGVLAAAGALAAGALVGCSTTFTDGARPGEANPGGGDTLGSHAHKAVVQLPLGPLTIEVGNPTREVDVTDGDDRAADGATWVPVAWTLGGNGADFGNAVPAFQFQVTLIADGRRYGLQAGQAGDSDGAASKYTPVVKKNSLDLVVQGSGRHLTAEVEYDGLTQRVDFDSGRVSAGLAAPLYRKNAQKPLLARAVCPLMSAVAARRFSIDTGTTCTVGAVRTTPYVGGLGWAASPDETWTLVPIDLHLLEIDAKQARARYDNFDIQQLQVTVDGAKPTTEILRSRDNDTLSILRDGVLVFRTSNKPESVRVSITVRGQNEYRRSQYRAFHGERTYQLS
jgi:hypothetical protein